MLVLLPSVSFAYGKRGIFLAPRFPNRDVWLLFLELLYVPRNLSVSFRLQIIAMPSTLLPIAGRQLVQFFLSAGSDHARPISQFR